MDVSGNNVYLLNSLRHLRFIFLIAVSISALTLASSTSICSDPSQNLYNNANFGTIQNYLSAASSLPLLGISLLALTISVDVVALGHIANKLFPNARLSNWISNEYWEIMKSGAIIAGVYLALIFLGAISTYFVASSSFAPQTFSGASRLSSIIYQITQSAGNYLYAVHCGSSAAGIPNGIYQGLSFAVGLSGMTSAMSTFTAGFQLNIPVFFAAGLVLGVSNIKLYTADLLAAPSDGYGGYDSMVGDFLVFLMIPIDTITIMQYYALPLFLMLGLVIFLPIGIALRAFPLLRGIGGTLIALGVGTSIIFPSIIIIVNMPVSVLVGQISAGVTSPESTTGFCSSGGVIYTICTAIQSILSPFTGLSSGPGKVGSDVGFASFETIFPAMNGIIYYSLIPITQLLLFAVDFIIFIPLTDSIAKSLGGAFRTQISSRFKV